MNKPVFDIKFHSTSLPSSKPSQDWLQSWFALRPRNLLTAKSWSTNESRVSIFKWKMQMKAEFQCSNIKCFMCSWGIHALRINKLQQWIKDNQIRGISIFKDNQIIRISSFNNETRTIKLGESQYSRRIKLWESQYSNGRKKNWL